MRIGLFGLFGGGNSGNDASLESMVAFLRRAGLDENVLCICADPERIERLYGLKSIRLTPVYDERSASAKLNRVLFRMPSRLYGIWHAWREMRNLDVLIVPGTGFLDDFQDSPFGWPFTILKWCAAARLLRKKVMFVCIGAGPIKGSLSRVFMKTAARCADYRSYRDKASKDFMRGIGIDVANDDIYPDIVFSLPGLVPPLAKGTTSIRVGVGVMSYFGWSKGASDGESIYRCYLEKLDAFVTWLLDNGHSVRLLTGDEGDWSAIEDFMKGLHASRPDSDRRLEAVRTYTLAELMGEIAQTDAVVVSRYHNLISALKLGRPPISLEYSVKNRALMAEMKLDAYCQNIEAFDLDWLKRQFNEMMRNHAKLHRQILDCDGAFAERLAAQEERLHQFLRVHSPAHTIVGAATVASPASDVRPIG